MTSLPSDRIAASILDTAGNTPLVELRRLNPNPRVRLLAKLEYFNPGGSIKDRPARRMIEEAERRGDLTPGKTILEATSGNTGIGLALVAAAKGYPLVLAMSEAVSEERKRILQALGAEIVLTPAALGTDGAIEVAYAMARENPYKYYCPDQFNNPDNVLAHYHGTAEEVWQQTGGAVTMVVATLGTSGTAMGLSLRLKERNPDIRIVGVEPYLQHKIQGLKNMKESYRPGIFDKNRLDEKINIQDEDAFEMARRLAREEALFVGMSSGAAVHVALEKVRQMNDGVVVVILPDSGERYLSTPLFRDRQTVSLEIYNTLSRSKEPFRPLHRDEVLIHTCGPALHEAPHLGIYRRFVLTDLIRRYLSDKGFRVRHITNIQDLSDHALAGAERTGTTPAAFSERCADIFRRDLERLLVLRDDVYPKASDTTDEMLKLVDRLMDRGFAYEKLRSVYFDISKLEGYGRLVNLNLGKIDHGRTVDLDQYEKDSPADFALLKRSTLQELKQGVYVKSRWGSVRPSWHLECAAIAMKHLGETFDIHVGGTDVVFPHAENVLAIGQAAAGKPPARYWLNADLVMVGGKKMSRSAGNALTLDEMARLGYRERDIRFFLLSVHYRKPLNYSPGAMETARNTVRRLHAFVQRLAAYCPAPDSVGGEADQMIYDLRAGFNAGLEDDLNIAGALSALFDFVGRVGEAMSRETLAARERDAVMDALKSIDGVLGILSFAEDTLPDEAKRLLEERDAFRKAGRWVEADQLRDRLTDFGVDLSDTPEGTVWRLR